MSGQAPIGSKLHGELEALMGEHNARVEMNGQRAARELAQQEQGARARYANSEQQARANMKVAEQNARHEHERLVPAIAASRESSRQAIEQSLLSARAKLIAEAALIPGALGDIPGAFADAAARGAVTLCPVPPRAFLVGQEAHAPAGVHAVPVLLPLIGSRGLVLRGAGGPARSFVDALFARIIATVPATSLRITTFDPEVHGLLSVFSELRNSMGSAFPMAVNDGMVLKEHLAEVMTTIQTNTSRMTPVGASNLLDIWETAMPKPTLNVLVVDDVPGSMDDSARKMLARIIESGPSRGVLVIVLQTGDRNRGGNSSWDETTPQERDNELLSERSMTELIFDAPSKGTVGVPVGNSWCKVNPIQELSYEAVKPLVGGVQAAAANDSGPTVPAKNLLPARGRDSSADGIEISLGRKENGDPLLVRLRTENPPLPNMLIGGDVGTGKSNLLHALNYAIAAKYPASEVELMLLDFKSGTEFQRYAPGVGPDGTQRNDWLPNASLVGLESDREFGYRVLEHVAREVDRRGNEFKRFGTNGYDGFRRNGGNMPRLVVLVDEFQTLFENDDEVSAESVRLLSSIMRKGRSFGVHMVLSTQTLSGIRALASQADAIFAQVPVRVALRLGRSESQVMLASGNLAASRLRFRGEVVLNENRGEGEEHNQFGVVTHAEPSFTAELQRRLWEDARPEQAPRLFRGTAFASRTGKPVGGRSLALGEVVDVPGTVVQHTFGVDPNRTLAIVGSDESVKCELVRSSVLSGLVGGSYSRVVFVGSHDEYFSHGEIDRVSALGTAFEAIPHGEAADWLVRNQLSLREEGTLVVVAETQRIRRLTNEILLESAKPAASFPPPQANTAVPTAGDEKSDLDREFDALFGGSPQAPAASGEIAADADILAEFGGLFDDNSYIRDGFEGAAAEQPAIGPDRSAEQVLQTLARSNEIESDLVVSMQLFSQVDAMFGYDRDGGNGIGGYALAKVPLGEMRSLFGMSAEETEASPRFYYARAGAGSSRMFAIPFGDADREAAL